MTPEQHKEILKALKHTGKWIEVALCDPFGEPRSLNKKQAGEMRSQIELSLKMVRKAVEDAMGRGLRQQDMISFANVAAWALEHHNDAVGAALDVSNAGLEGWRRSLVSYLNSHDSHE